MHPRIHSRFLPLVLAALAVMVVVGAQAGVALAARAPKPPAPPIVTAKASTGTVGAKLNLNVVIKTSGKVGPASATAVVHFASGDRAVTLPKVVKLKNGASLTGTVAVAADEVPGNIVIDVTVTYGGRTFNRTVTAVIAPAPTPTPELVVEATLTP